MSEFFPRLILQFETERRDWILRCIVRIVSNIPVWTRCAFLGAFFAAGFPVLAQVPDAPQPQPTDASPAGQNQNGQQTKRILGIVPNFRAVSTDTKLPPQTVKKKFLTATNDSFDYSSIFVPAAVAGYSMGTDATPEFHQGAAGYGRYFWHAALDQINENYMVEFVVPAVAHQDTRYYTLGRGGFGKRMGYALSRALITRSDGGREEFNVSEVVGAGAAAGVSRLYYPARERNFSNTGKEWALDIGVDAAGFALKEFWPDINQHVFHRAKAGADGQQ